MKRKGFTSEQIIGKLREEVFLSKGTTAREVSRKLAITEPTDWIKNSSASPFGGKEWITSRNIHIDIEIRSRRFQGARGEDWKRIR